MTETVMIEAKNIEGLLKKLSKSPNFPFPPAGTLNAPTERGVYIIRDPEGCVLHVGQTPRGKNGLQQRLRNHICGKSSFVRGHFDGEGSRLRSGCSYQYIKEEDPRKRALLESLAVGRLCPVHLGLHEIRAND